MIEEVVVEAVEAPAFVVAQAAVLMGELGCDAGVVFAFLVGVFNEEDVVDEAEQTLADAVVLVSVFESAEVCGYFLLGVDELFEFVAVATAGGEGVLFGCLCVWAEEVGEHPFEDEGACLYFRVNPEVEFLTEGVGGEGESGVEDAEQAMECIGGNLPDAEEAEHVVNAVSVEVFAHFAEA